MAAKIVPLSARDSRGTFPGIVLRDDYVTVAARKNVSDNSDTKSLVSESKEVTETLAASKLEQLRRRLKIVKLSGKSKSGQLLRAELRMLYGGAIAVNFNANKYTQTIAGGVNLSWSSLIQNVDGYASLDTLFNEFFIRGISIEYQPVNKSSSNSTASASAAGSPGQLNTVGATIYSIPHHQAAYADNASAYYQAREVKYSKFVNLADTWKFSVKNDEKFSWDGEVGDMTTATSMMQWCTFPQVAAYGGLIGIITPFSSGAAAGIGDLLENGVFGNAVISLDVALRARI
jgi:hypothetical protein